MENFMNLIDDCLVYASVAMSVVMIKCPQKLLYAAGKRKHAL